MYNSSCHGPVPAQWLKEVFASIAHSVAYKTYTVLTFLYPDETLNLLAKGTTTLRACVYAWHLQPSLGDGKSRGFDI